VLNKKVDDVQTTVVAVTYKISGNLSRKRVYHIKRVEGDKKNYTCVIVFM